MHVGVLSITSSFISASFVDNDLFYFPMVSLLSTLTTQNQFPIVSWFFFQTMTSNDVTCTRVFGRVSWADDIH